MRILLIALLINIAGCADTLVTRRGAELKVTRAVLYQNGIGYFERRGQIAEDVLHLRVRPDQIRDFLKSLTVVDMRDGRAVSIDFPIEKGRAQLMSDLPEQVRAQGGVLAIAQAFRGARCHVVADVTATGRLVGVEDLGGGEKGHDWRMSVLTESGGLVQLRVDRVRELKVLDGTLEIGLRKALDVALDSGQWKPVDVAVRLSGAGPHDLVVSYVVEMPTWKPAYRLVLAKEKKALLQGWAVVDNVSGDDWKGVKLSLTAGTPLAFTYDLYTPRYPRRPNLQPVDEVAQIPTDAFNAVGGMPTGAPAPPPPPPEPEAAEEKPAMSSPATRSRGDEGKMGKKAKKKPGRYALEKEARDEDEPAISGELLEKSFKSLVAGQRVGSLFRYDLDEPVTIDERQSALVNIVNARVPGEEVLLFRVGADAVSPYRAVRFSNDSGFVLEAGPIAIYHEDAFVGEALASRIEKTASTFVPFAQDGRVRVQLAEEQKEQGMSLIKLVQGVLTVDTKLVMRHSYDVDNGSGEEVTLYVRRERRPGWKLSGVEGIIEEGGAYYLPIKLPKTGRTKVTVEEQTPVQRTVDIWNSIGRQAIAMFVSDAKSDAKLVAQLKEALTLQSRSGTLDDQIANLEEQRNTLSTRQNEVRANLQVLGKSSKNEDLKKKLESTLSSLETSLNDVTRKQVSLSIERGEVRDRLAVLMKSITIE